MPSPARQDGRISQRFFGAHTYRRTAFAGDYTGLEIQRTLINRAAQLADPDPRHGLHHPAPRPRQRRLRRLRLRPRRRHPLHHPRRRGDPRRRRTHPDLAAHLVAPRREHRRLVPPRRRGGRPDPRSRARPVPPVRADRARERGRHAGLRGRARRGRHPPQRPRRAVHEALRPRADGAVHPRPGRARRVHRDQGGPRHAARRRLARRLAPAARDDHASGSRASTRPCSSCRCSTSPRTPIEIAPTAHYSMGGVWVRPEDHGTGVEGLYAIGEASSGLHGANRLGGNSLIELLVYGRIVGQAAAAYSASLTAQQRSAAAVAEARARGRRAARRRRPGERPGPAARAPRHHDRARRRRARRGRAAAAAWRELDEIEERMADLGVHPDIAGFQDLAHAFDLKASASLAARATLEAALERRETRGCHNRSDYPNSTSRSRSIWSGPDPAGSNAKRFPVYLLIFRLVCVRCAATASSSNKSTRATSLPKKQCAVACAR